MWARMQPRGSKALSALWALTEEVLAPFVAPTRLETFVGVVKGLWQPPSCTSAYEEQKAGWIPPNHSGTDSSPMGQPGSAITSGTGWPAACIHPAWSKIAPLLFHYIITSHNPDITGRRGGGINACQMNSPSLAGQAESFVHAGTHLH